MKHTKVNLKKLGEFIDYYVSNELAADYRWKQDDSNDGLQLSKEFEVAFISLVNKKAPRLIDEIIEACTDELGLDHNHINDYRDYVEQHAAIAAQDVLDTYYEYAS